MMVSVSSALYEGGTQLRVLGEREFALRREARDGDASRLQRWVDALELSLVFVSAHEAIVSLGYRRAADIVENVEKIDAIVERLSRLKPDDVFRANRDALAQYATVQIPADAPATADPDEVVRAVRSLLLHVPEGELIPSGRAIRPDLAHQCRLALDGLRAFVVRHQHPDRTRFAVVGHAYADGRLSIDEVAVLLGAAVPDAVAHLEEQGFRRAPDALRLAPDARSERLRRIRDDRLARNSEPAPDPDLVRREVIASQRIEDIDARAWLPR